MANIWLKLRYVSETMIRDEYYKKVAAAAGEEPKFSGRRGAAGTLWTQGLGHGTVGGWKSRMEGYPIN